MSAPLSPVRALILRAPLEAAPYVAALHQLTIVAQACPLTKLQWLPEGQQALQRAVTSLADNCGAFLASHTSVEAFAQAIAATDAAHAGDQDLRLASQWHAVTAGPATNDALTAACANTPGLARRLASQTIVTGGAHGSIGAAAAASLAARGVVHVLVPRARHGRRDIFTALERIRLPFTSVDCYETITHITDDARSLLGDLTQGQIALVVAMAPSSVTALAVGLDHTPLADTSCRWIALGDTTREALMAAGIPEERIATAAEPSPQGVAQAVANFA